jgi:hypothetical protein
MKLQNAIEDMVQRIASPAVLVATVTAVDASAATIDLQPAEGAEILGCRLRAIDNGSDEGVIAWPPVGATVLAARIGAGHSQFVMLATDTIERHTLVIKDKLRIQVSSNGDITITQQNAETVIDTQKLYLGGKPSAQPVPRGNDLGDRLGEIWDQLTAVTQALITYATAQAGVAGTPPFTPLVGALTTLASALAPVIAESAVDRAKYPTVLSNSTKVN